MLSIIIPTLNEEDYLAVLLDSIKKQDIQDCEIIVADAGSTDNTLEIARQYGCIIIPGGLPAKGRNSGAGVARGDMIFFLDADTILPADFLKKSLEEFKARKLSIASFRLRHYPGGIISFLMLTMLYDNMIVVLESIVPYAATGILVTNTLFATVGGYNENIPLTEDYDLGRRAVKYGKFGIIRSAILWVSDRRFRKEGWIHLCLKYILNELHNLFMGPATADIFNYQFGHYKEKEKKK
jgi:glycosyltransferase involved in cell wall biosynthesis